MITKPPRTRFKSTVKEPKDKIVLKPASNNNKLGKGKLKINKGPWKGMPLFSLTLEERKTCPTDCHFWEKCYGDNMFLAERFKHGIHLQNKIKSELCTLFSKYEKVAIRLHVLGDFYSVSYVKFWESMLNTYPGLHVFGYTALQKGSVFQALYNVMVKFSDRFIIRLSRNKEYNDNNPLIRYAAKADFEGNGIICPEQKGKTESCLTCGLCFNKNFSKTIKFIEH